MNIVTSEIVYQTSAIILIACPDYSFLISSGQEKNSNLV